MGAKTNRERHNILVAPLKGDVSGHARNSPTSIRWSSGFLDQSGFFKPLQEMILRWGLSCTRTPGKTAGRGLELRIDRRGGACSKAWSSPSRPDATRRLIMKGLCGAVSFNPECGSLRRAERAAALEGLGEARARLACHMAIGRFTRECARH